MLRLLLNEKNLLSDFRRKKSLVTHLIQLTFFKTAVDFLLDLEVPAFMIASFEKNYLTLIEKAAAVGKPLHFLG